MSALLLVILLIAVLLLIVLLVDVLLNVVPLVVDLLLDIRLSVVLLVVGLLDVAAPMQRYHGLIDRENSQPTYLPHHTYLHRKVGRYILCKRTKGKSNF